MKVDIMNKKEKNRRLKYGALATVITVLGVLLVHLIEYVTMRFANPIHRLLGEGGTTFLTRISGMLLAAIATQLMVNAVLSIIAGM